MKKTMAPLLCIRELMLDNLPDALCLELVPGMQALCIVADDLQLRHLLHLCTGITLPAKGQVLLDGCDTARLSRQQLLEQRRQFGIVTASGGLIANLKLWENIALPLYYRLGQFPAAPEQLALTLLEELGCRGNLMTLPGHLTTFERRSAAFVRAAISGPRLMVYAGCFDNLPSEQRQLLLAQSQQLQRTVSGLASLYLTTSSTLLNELLPDVTCNLMHHAHPTTRSA
jgi:phospholipid/cholesterol/gamma-HCH transport system ATP-binding protein